MDIIAISEAAQRHSIDPKRLRGAVWRGTTPQARLSDPHGDPATDLVDEASVERWIAATAPGSGAQR